MGYRDVFWEYFAPALAGALVTTLVGGVTSVAPDFIDRDRLFYTEMKFPKDIDGEFRSLVTLVNPRERPISPLNVAITPKNGIVPDVLWTWNDNDFTKFSSMEEPTLSVSEAGIVKIQFPSFPQEGRYAVMLSAEGEIDIGSKAGAVVAKTSGTGVFSKKLKREYIRSSRFEHWYYFVSGLVGGFAGAIAFRLILNRKIRRRSNT
jgi:hypothetical protein